MSFLRRRLAGSSDDRDERSPSPAALSPFLGTNKDEVAVPIQKLKDLNENLKRKPKASKKRSFWLFTIGSLFGIIIAIVFAGENDMLPLLADLNLDSMLDVLPEGLLKDAKNLQKNEREAIAYDSFQIGLHAKQRGIEAKHPIIMIPGVISTGLESWGTDHEDSRKYFRKRLWGSWSMMQALLMDRESWKKHIMLDKFTGLDPKGIKLRAAQGFDASDFFITGYWLWSKILENLAAIGYDPTTAYTAAYDWRLSYANLEVRDQYFTRLKNHIETSSKIQGHKVVLLSHSMGSQVLYYFFKWVEAEGYGNGGSDWVDTHVASWINISGSMLGALKSITAVLSGEMKDTAQLNAFAVYGMEKFLSRSDRCEILRAMPGISSMLPIGGEAVWGNKTWAPDDAPNQNISYGNFITFRGNKSTYHAKNLTVTQALPYILERGDKWYEDQVMQNYSYGIAHTRKEVEANERIPKKWMNPLETRLPFAPNMKIYCFYGMGKPTERSYFYREESDPAMAINVSIDASYHVDNWVDHGVVIGEGDGTVNLLSSGYMCSKGWHMKRYNPAKIPITVVEMPHEPDRFSPRGGPNTADHVDVLGRSSLNEMIMTVAGGKGDTIQNEYHSKIREYVERIKIYEEDDDDEPLHDESQE